MINNVEDNNLFIKMSKTYNQEKYIETYSVEDI